jgi:hypothetical protein
MSRVEVIQNNKIKNEIERTGIYIDKAANYTLKQAIPLSRMFNIPRILISVFRISAIVF